ALRVAHQRGLHRAARDLADLEDEVLEEQRHDDGHQERLDVLAPRMSRTLRAARVHAQFTHFSRYTPSLGLKGQNTSSARPRIISRGTNGATSGLIWSNRPVSNQWGSPHSSTKRVRGPSGSPRPTVTGFSSRRDEPRTTCVVPSLACTA